jgi:hypothetical protein
MFCKAEFAVPRSIQKKQIPYDQDIEFLNAKTCGT